MVSLSFNILAYSPGLPLPHSTPLCPRRILTEFSHYTAHLYLKEKVQLILDYCCRFEHLAGGETITSPCMHTQSEDPTHLRDLHVSEGAIFPAIEQEKAKSHLPSLSSPPPIHIPRPHTPPSTSKDFSPTPLLSSI